MMNKKNILLVSLSHLACDVNGGTLPALLPFLISDYGFSYSAAASLMLAYSSLSSIIQPLFGFLSDRISKPWFIPAGILLAGLGMSSVGFLQSYWAIFAAVALSGTGAALFHPEGARFASKVSGSAQGTGLSIFSVGGNTGYVLGPMLAVALVHAFGLRGTSVLALVTASMASLMFIRIVRMPLENHEPSGGQVRDAASGSSLPDNNWKEFSKLTVSIICRSALMVGCSTFRPLYWIGHFGQSEASGAFALTLYGAFGVFSNILGGVLSDHFGYRRIVRISHAALVPVAIMFPFVENLYAAYALLIPLGFALYAPFSSIVVLGQRYLARNIGFASGITLGLATTMGGIVAPLLGKIADTWGLGAALQTMSVFAILGTIFAFLLASPSRNLTE